MFEKTNTEIEGCCLLKFRRLEDSRGWFTKTYHTEWLSRLGIDFPCEEEYFSLSTRGVFRGLHFQVPPHDIAKLVTCLSGSMRDYVVDLRKGSPTFGKWLSFDLDQDTPQSVLVPKGLAHGFYVTSETALIQCKSTGLFNGPADMAISYKSFSLSAEITDPVLSEKDRDAPLFENFENPFIYRK